MTSCSNCQRCSSTKQTQCVRRPFQHVPQVERPSSLVSFPISRLLWCGLLLLSFCFSES